MIKIEIIAMQHRLSSKLPAISFSIAMSFSGCLMAGDDINESRSVDPEGIVTIKNVRGDIEILGWNKPEIKIEGELDDMTKKIVFEVTGTKTRIDILMPRFNVNHGDGSDLKIRVPSLSRVSFTGVSTDTVIKDIYGGVKVESVSGEIEVENNKGKLIIKTISGNIEVSESTGNARISTVSGEMNLEIAGESLTLETISGDIEGKFEDFMHLRSSTISGNQKLSGQLNNNGEVTISSVSGDVRLELQESVNATIFARTGIGGEIENDLSEHKPQVQFPAQGLLEATLGDGSGRISISTVSADIRLDRR
ncbi:MAG: DUF4097 and DUF4098 domain-containing protein YvlB [Candidatus Azotimanducaceae bacterium]